MWICENCGTENEIKFKFCWSCGRTRAESKPVEFKPEIKQVPKNPEPKTEPVRAVGKTEEVRKIEEIKPANEIKPAENSRVEKRRTSANEPELFATVLPYSAKPLSDETDWETKVFRVAVRLVGLFLLYQVLVALPDLIALVYSAVKNSAELSGALTADLMIPIAKLLFYFVVGIYLISSRKVS